MMGSRRRNTSAIVLALVAALLGALTLVTIDASPAQHAARESQTTLTRFEHLRSHGTPAQRPDGPFGLPTVMVAQPRLLAAAVSFVSSVEAVPQRTSRRNLPPRGPPA